MQKRTILGAPKNVLCKNFWALKMAIISQQHVKTASKVSQKQIQFHLSLMRTCEFYLCKHQKEICIISVK